MNYDFCCNFLAFKTTLTSEFLKAISAENRRRQEQKTELLKVYIQISVKFYLDEETLQEIKFMVIGLVNYITPMGNINGLIFETSLIQNPGNLYSETFNGEVYVAIMKFKKFMKAMEHGFGNKLKLGLAVSSLIECEFSMKEMLADTVSLFEMVVYRDSGIDTCATIQKASNCMKLFQRKFSGMEFHKIREVFEVTTM